MSKAVERYWARRKAQMLYEEMEKAEHAADEISKLYAKASSQLAFEEQKIFETYQREYHLTETEARRFLNTFHDKTSLDELRRKLKEEKDKKELLAQLDSAAYAWRMERLQQLQNEIDELVQELAVDVETAHRSHYTQALHDGYYRRIFETQKKTGLAFSFSKIDKRTIKHVLQSDWSGKNFSKRIWGNTDELAKTLKEELLINLMTGRTQRETAKIIQNKFASSAMQARRLVRTESTFIAEQADELTYKECEVEHYRYVAVLDMRTSLVCRNLDGQVFKVSEMQPGKNAPPMHPWCRSTTTANLSDDILAKLKRRARDPITGKTYQIPANMNYKQWYDTYVAGNPKTVEFLKEQNKQKDERQWKRYGKVLGDLVPKKLDAFQTMKYTNSEKFEHLKDRYKVVSTYAANAGTMTPTKIYELDRLAFETKQLFTGSAKERANIAAMELDGKTKFANSQVDKMSDSLYLNFKGDKSQLVFLPAKPQFTSKVVGPNDRYMDSEKKLFEYAAQVAADGKTHTLQMLSEKCMCESCQGVMKQFQRKYPKVTVNVVSNSRKEAKWNRNKPWNWR